MITHIRMKNFKSWKDSGEVKFAPLTGFFGTNSSGKSSLLQMLLLLKQAAEHSDPNEVIFFGDQNSLVNLGNFREVIHGHNSQTTLGLEFGCKVQKPFTIKIQHAPYRSSSDFSLNVKSFTFNATIFCRENKISVQEGSYRVEPENEKQVVDDSNISFIVPGSHVKSGNAEQIITGNFSRKIYGEPYNSHASNNPIIQFSSEFKNLFSRVYYLGPTRVDPQRRYSWNGGHPQHIRQWGNQTVDALLSARVRKLKTLHQEEEMPIEDRVSYWLQEMELAHSFSLDWTSHGSTKYEIRIQKSPGSAAVTLVDMGYGLGQFLPVLVLCYYAPEGSTLILEQPGIHLHPKVQSQLADLLIEVITERNLQILVESHSEHLLNRLQRRIAEEKVSVDKTALYFCRNDEGVSNIERLKMDEFGNIANWPENFFGDEMGDLFAMTKAQRKRQKKVEG
ncbi:MAG: DUF3696 domain-containing protein [Candidatus Poribacteria bacterium]|nr:DUF3696 domain-containing protein [Candidatus Poribacteria bacterium]